jgi:isoleucyl-tRNA synthetase
VDDLTNWYIRRSRRRFWKSQNDADKQHAYRTLRYALVQLCKVAAPFTPFISEAMYRALRGQNMPESVHLCDFPIADAAARDPALEQRMALVQTVVQLGRQLRTDHDLKVRQPLAKLHVVSADPEIRRQVAAFEDLVMEELNVKALTYDADETALAHITAKADFRKLGPQFGPRMKEVAAAIATLSPAAAVANAAGQTVALTVGSDTVSLAGESVVVQRTPREGLVVAAAGSVIVALETKLTPELVHEGFAREFVSKIQNLRKDSDLEVTQRIAITFAADAEIAAAVKTHGEYIKGETLALSCERVAAIADVAAVDLNGHACTICIAKA